MCGENKDIRNVPSSSVLCTEGRELVCDYVEICTIVRFHTTECDYSLHTVWSELFREATILVTEQGRKNGDCQVPYFDEADVVKGFERRERSRTSCQDETTRRRNAIANGTVKPSNTDDAEFLGWWAYGKLTGFLNPARHSAIALLFESMGYIFHPWWWSVADKKGVLVSTDEKSNERTDRLKENINGIITKKSLSLKWISDRNISQQGLRSLPMSKVSGDERRLEGMNEDIFLNTSEEELNLQLKVEHNVLMHDSSWGKSIRQRKGAKLKKFCRKITLMDAAAQFVNGITGGDRSTASSFSLGYNKNALQSVLLFGTSLRDILEEMTFSDLSIKNSAIATEGRDSSCLLYTSPSPRDLSTSRMPSSA